jgi:transmembrane sensor
LRSLTPTWRDTCSFRETRMTELRTPLKVALQDEPSEQELKRIWSAIVRQRAKKQARGELRIVFGIAPLVAIAVAILLLFLRGTESAPRAGALLSDNKPLTALGAAASSSASLSDGSRIELGPSARLEIVDNSSRSFVSVLRRGHATFDVRPGGPRLWTIEAGLASVEVVGTRFSVTRDESSVEVEVERGLVLVRGERVPDRIQRLGAGDRLKVSVAQATEAPPALAEPTSAALPELLSDSANALAPSVARVAAGAEHPGFDQLLITADTQRRRGELAAAEKTLNDAIASAPDRSRAALAAFTLGKLLLDGAGRPADAARAFSRAVTLGPPTAIAEDALARLMEAEDRAGNVEAARTAARSYRERFPNGRRAYAVGRWLEQH